MSDEPAPYTVKAAAWLICLSQVLYLLGQVVVTGSVGGSRSANAWPWLQIVTVALSLLLAWLVARLNRLAYWLTVVLCGQALLLAILSLLIRPLRGPYVDKILMSRGLFSLFDTLALFAVFVLLVVRPSRKAAWAFTKGLHVRRAT